MKPKQLIGIVIASFVAFFLIITFVAFVKIGNANYMILPEEDPILMESEARDIAKKYCIKGGETLDPGFYSERSGTWWFEANLNTTREDCRPVCVVFEEDKTASLYWRCK